MSTLGADKGYFSKGFIALLRTRKIAPHIARIEGRSAAGLDERTTRHDGYAISQRERKRIEEICDWMKTVGGFRKSRFVGIAKTQLMAYMGVPPTTCCAWHDCSRTRDRYVRNKRLARKSTTNERKKIRAMVDPTTPRPMNPRNACFKSHSSTAC